MKMRCHNLFKTAIIPLLLALLLPGCSTTYRPIYDKTVQDIHDNLKAEDLAAERGISNMPIAEIVKNGKSYLTNGNINLARIFFIQALNKDSSCIPALIGLGDILMLEGKVSDALELFESINDKHPKDKTVLYKLATAHRLIGKTDMAIDYANQALLLDPDSPEIQTELALIYDAVGSYPLAEPLYRSIVNVMPASANAYNNLGCNLILQKRYNEAISTLTQASTLAPKDSKIKNNLAIAYGMNKKFDSAFDILKKSVGEAEALNNLGYLYMNMGEWEKAESCLKRALETKPVYYVKASENLEKLNRMKLSASSSVPGSSRVEH